MVFLHSESVALDPLMEWLPELDAFCVVGVNGSHTKTEPVMHSACWFHKLI